MGIIILLVVLVIVGFIGYKVFYSPWENSFFELLFYLLGCFSALLLIVAIVIAIITQTTREGTLENFKEKEKFIEYCISQKGKVSGEEKVKLAESIKDHNESVNTSIRYKDNFWINWFITEELADEKVYVLKDIL
jgi:hypothetical protein